MIYRVLGALSFVAVIVVGCTSDDCPLCTGGSGGTTATTTGSGGAEGGSGGSGGSVTEACAGVPSNSNPACDACNRFECCTEAQACAAETECLAWLDCEGACDLDDGACLRACWEQYPASPLKGAYLACKHRSCAATCGMEACSDDAYGYEDSLHDAGWGTCQRQHCCIQYATCLEDAACEDLLECYATCDGDWGECNVEEQLPAHMLLAAVWACRAEYCIVETEGEDACTTVFGWGGSCDACQREKCCDETYACSTDAECIVYFNCLRICGNDDACKLACDASYWKGGGASWVHQYCLHSECSSECGGPLQTCGGFSYPSAGCKNCMDGSCCAAGEACGTDAQCAGFSLCLKGCAGDTACEAKCRNLADSAGAATYDAWQSCRATNCASECG